MLALLVAEMVVMVVAVGVVVFGAIRYLEGLMAFYICLHVCLTQVLEYSCSSWTSQKNVMTQEDEKKVLCCIFLINILIPSS